MACSCVDCGSSCTPSDVTMDRRKFEVFGWNGYGVIAGFGLLGLSTIFAVFVVWSNSERGGDVDGELVFSTFTKFFR